VVARNIEGQPHRKTQKGGSTSNNKKEKIIHYKVKFYMYKI
jgi:hypothetical protein